ncbi:MAG: hypothetical protein ACUVX8_06985 [Candidatus Zipacnadales bacterium]
MRAAILAVIAIAAGVGSLLTGCSAEEEVIGRGPMSLIFENNGTKKIEVEVHWTDQTGIHRSCDFDLAVNGRVKLRTTNRPEYRILLEDALDTPGGGKPPSAQFGAHPNEE